MKNPGRLPGFLGINALTEKISVPKISGRGLYGFSMYITKTSGTFFTGPNFGGQFSPGGAFS